MKSFLAILLFTVLFSIAAIETKAQCSLCTRTAQQLGEKPARGLNAGIIYLAFTPLAIVGFIGYKWWKKTNSNVEA